MDQSSPSCGMSQLLTTSSRTGQSPAVTVMSHIDSATTATYTIGVRSTTFDPPLWTAPQQVPLPFPSPPPRYDHYHPNISYGNPLGWDYHQPMPPFCYCPLYVLPVPQEHFPQGMSDASTGRCRSNRSRKQNSRRIISRRRRNSRMRQSGTGPQTSERSRRNHVPQRAPSKPKSQRLDFACYNCTGIGHVARNCSSPRIPKRRRSIWWRSTKGQSKSNPLETQQRNPRTNSIIDRPTDHSAEYVQEIRTNDPETESASSYQTYHAAPESENRSEDENVGANDRVPQPAESEDSESRPPRQPARETHRPMTRSQGHGPREPDVPERSTPERECPEVEKEIPTPIFAKRMCSTGKPGTPEDQSRRTTPKRADLPSPRVHDTPPRHPPSPDDGSETTRTSARLDVETSEEPPLLERALLQPLPRSSSESDRQREGTPSPIRPAEEPEEVHAETSTQTEMRDETREMSPELDLPAQVWSPSWPLLSPPGAGYTTESTLDLNFQEKEKRQRAPTSFSIQRRRPNKLRRQLQFKLSKAISERSVAAVQRPTQEGWTTSLQQRDICPGIKPRQTDVTDPEIADRPNLPKKRRGKISFAVLKRPSSTSTQQEEGEQTITSRPNSDQQGPEEIQNSVIRARQLLKRYKRTLQSRFQQPNGYLPKKDIAHDDSIYRDNHSPTDNEVYFTYSVKDPTLELELNNTSTSAECGT